MDDFINIVDRYQNQRGGKEDLARKFLSNERPFMIFQTPDGNVWGDNRSPEQSFINNMEYIKDSLNIPSDHLPLLEPWFGTGVFANMYGCPYVWRNGEAPAVRYRYLSIDEIRGISKPKWQDSEIAQLVLDTIRYFKSKTGDYLPIVWTDTQSASDTASLVLDAVELFAGCLEEPEIIMKFMSEINDLIIEFSQVQAEQIGNALAKPGHIMLTNAGFKGMAIADDNLAVASPNVNCEFNLPLNEKIGKAMGGVAIHSCGTWTHTMPMLQEIVPSCVAIDFAVDKCWDPNPNQPEKVRDAMVGSSIHLHARTSGEINQMIDTVKRIFHPELKLIIHPQYIDLPTAQKNYETLDKLLSELYSVNK
jgi:hypothetical protein